MKWWKMPPKMTNKRKVLCLNVCIMFPEKNETLFPNLEDSRGIQSYCEIVSKSCDLHAESSRTLNTCINSCFRMRKMQTTHTTSMRWTFPKIQEKIIFKSSKEIRWKNRKKNSSIARNKKWKNTRNLLHSTRDFVRWICTSSEEVHLLLVNNVNDNFLDKCCT